MLLPPDIQLIDYQIVPAHQTKDYLARGFTLYGTPISAASTVFDKLAFYQAVIKTQSNARTSKQTLTGNVYLKKVEQQCVALLAEGKTPHEIANQVHRTTRRVRTVLIELRNRLGYKTNAQMLLELNRLGLL